MSKKVLNIILLIFGVLLAIAGGIVLRNIISKSAGGVCIGVGAGLFGMSFSNLWLIRFNKNHPKLLKQSEIESADERNIMIRNKAKAKVADIIQWLIMGIAYINIMINGALWFTLIIVCVFLFKHILELYYMNKFQREF